MKKLIHRLVIAFAMVLALGTGVAARASEAEVYELIENGRVAPVADRYAEGQNLLDRALAMPEFAQLGAVRDSHARVLKNQRSRKTKGGTMNGNKIRAACVLAAAALTVHVSALAQEAAAPVDRPAAKAEVIYDKALAEGWQNWSWAKTELSFEIAGSARRPIKVEAGPWEALYLHHTPFSTAGFSYLTLLIQGSAPDGQVRIHGLIEGKVASEGHPVSISNTGWKLVKVPLATLGVDDKTADGFWVQNGTGAALPRFYVTEIKLE